MGSRSTTASICAHLARLALVAATLAVAPAARAQTDTELRAARELFQDAYRDEQDRRYPEALEKFQRVAKVKETGAVRYRIASVLADMGRLREARDLFRALARSGAAGDAAIADSAAEEAAELGRKIPKLTLTLDNPPDDARVMIDGAPVSVAARSTFELDPGDHVVAASSGSRIVHEKKIALAEGAAVSHVVSFGPGGRDTSLGIVAVAGGGALLVTSAVLLALREGAISDIKDKCPGNVCPASTRGDVDGDRERANLFRPLAIGLGIGGLVAAGVGVYLLVHHAGSGGASMPTRVAASFGTRSAFVRGLAFAF